MIAIRQIVYAYYRYPIDHAWISDRGSQQKSLHHIRILTGCYLTFKRKENEAKTWAVLLTSKFEPNHEISLRIEVCKLNRDIIPVRIMRAECYR